MTISKRSRVWLGLVALAALGMGGWALDRRFVCAGIFLRLERSAQPSWLVHYRERRVTERAYEFAGGSGRLYQPQGQPQAPGIVLAHGIHEDGIKEPRLVGLARALAGAGYSVLTPAVVGLAHYRIVHDDVDLIAAAARALAHQLGQPKVIVFGISFAGGLAMRAACEPDDRGAISRVIALGPHHDASRVARFYLGEPALGPSGERAPVEPHPYGPFVLWMSFYGERHDAPLTDAQRDELKRRVLAESHELGRASPRYCSEPIRVPLFLVHGTGDRVVPYTETLWNEQQFAGQTPVRTLISPAIVHAEYAPPSWGERLSLIEFMVAALY